MQDLGISVLFEGNNFLRLLEGLWVTIRLAIIAMGFSILFGTLFGILMTIKNKLVKGICRIYLEFIRIMPPLVLLFLMYFGMTRASGVHIPGEQAAIYVFTLWGTAEMGDLVRGAYNAIPNHQRESGLALGFTRFQTTRYIIIPQTIRQLIPSAVNLFTRMVKTTSLVALIGVIEVVKVGKQIIDAARFQTPDAALWIYGVIFLLYFAVCFPMSKLSELLERKMKGEQA
jgi:polar amino acid transport system permease protein